jgi:hypothetical protein
MSFAISGFIWRAREKQCVRKIKTKVLEYRNMGFEMHYSVTPIFKLPTDVD